jgi:hypothetical protein
MPKRKHVKKVRVAPRTDANQGVREHEAMIRKQTQYFAKKLAELRAKQMAAAKPQEAPSVVDGMSQGSEPES